MTEVSLFCSAVRPKLWSAYFQSLSGTTVKTQVVFSGRCKHDEVFPFHQIAKDLGIDFKYIYTEDLKPSQNYHIASLYCDGDAISWSCDDAEYPNDVLGKAYRHWYNSWNEKLILSIQTKESGYGQKYGKLFPMKEHTFFSLMPETPLMAPMALMGNKFFKILGGYDRRYCSGQAENDIVMRAYQRGATVEIFGDKDCYIDIDHLTKSIAIGESTDEDSFRQRPFARGYEIDRQVLENSWTTFDQAEAFKRLQSGERPFNLRRVSSVQLDKPEFYEDKDLFIKSQSNKGHWQ